MTASIIYWSNSGNTESMANNIYDGMKSAGYTVNFKRVDQANVQDIDCDVLVLGCPAMGDEELEQTEFEPFMESIQSKIDGKNIALFGSHDWGDGEWMRKWEERIKDNNGNLVSESLVVNLTPSDDDLENCKSFGAKLVNS